MRSASYVLILGALILGSSAAPALSEEDKPIIAQLYADAATYDGREVTIYGLVIEVTDSGDTFMLQDVSQMPLKVVRTDHFPAFVGDQMLVKGIFQANKGQPYIQTDAIAYTKVLGGGGCC